MKQLLLAMLGEVVDSFRKNYNFMRGLNDDPIESAKVVSFKSKTYIPIHGTQEKSVDVWIVEILLNGVSVVKVCKVMNTYNEKEEVVPVSDDQAEEAAVKELLERLVLEGVSTIFKLSPLKQAMTPSLN
ncbi:MAG TPA: hypothetical protein VGK10_10430 [Prolixibacteraceae bacterium]